MELKKEHPMIFRVSHLDAIFGPLLQVRNDRVVPQVNKPRSKFIHCDWAGQEKARA